MLLLGLSNTRNAVRSGEIPDLDIVVGSVFVEKSLIWGFTFTYVLLRFVSPTGFPATLLLCMWSGVAADQVSRRCQKRRRVV